MPGLTSRRGRRRRTTITEGSGQDTVHRRVGGEHRAGGPEPLSQRGLQMAGDGDDNRRRLASRQLVNQLELAVGPQGCL